MRFFSAVLVCGRQFDRTLSHAVQATSDDKPPARDLHTALREDEVRNEQGTMVSAKLHIVGFGRQRLPVSARSS
jgi:hypothetical protein